MEPPVHLLNASIVDLGSAPLLSPLLNRLQHNKQITIVGIGSSITARHGGCTRALSDASSSCSRPQGWLRLFFDGLNQSFPHPRHRLLNAGMPASAPSAFTECLTWLPSEVDLYVLEFVAARDIADLAVRLLTRSTTRAPVLVFVAFHRWILPMEGAHNRMMRTALVSGMPFISQLRGLSSIAPKDAWETLVKQAASCNANNNYDDERCWNPAAQAPDGLHPSTQIGQAYMGHALRLWLRRAYDRHLQRDQNALNVTPQLAVDASVRALTGGSRSLATRRVTLACFTFDARRIGNASLLGEALREGAQSVALDAQSKNKPSKKLSSLLKHQHLHHKSHHEAMGPDGGQPPRVVWRDGFVYSLDFPPSVWRSSEAHLPVRDGKASLAGFCPGDRIALDVSLPSTTRTGRMLRQRVIHQPSLGTLVRPYVAFDHLTSWSGMGRALVECVDGCACEPSVINGHSPEEKASLRALHVIEVTTLSHCLLTITILNASASGEHTVKLMRVAVGAHAPASADTGVSTSMLIPGAAPPPSPPPPPPPPFCTASGLKGDAPGSKRCESFCRKQNAPRHCAFCKCSGCSFCGADGRPADLSSHTARDLATARLIADTAAREAAARVPPPSPPAPPPILGVRNASTGLFVCVPEESAAMHAIQGGGRAALRRGQCAWCATARHRGGRRRWSSEL